MVCCAPMSMDLPARPYSLLLLACMLVGSLLGRAGAQDADQALAKERFQRGVASYEAGQYGEALADFQEAYRLKPHPLVRVNIANCYDKLDRPVEAIFHFDLFMSSKQGSPEQRAEIKEALKGLRKRVGKLMLDVAPDGAHVTIDDSDERRAPILEPITLKAGPHEVAVSLDGYDTLRRTVDVLAEETLEVSLHLTRPVPAVVPVPVAPPAEVQAAGPTPTSTAPPEAVTEPDQAEAAPVAATEPVKEPTRSGGVPIGVWIAGGASLALATTGMITGLLVGSAEQDFDDSVRNRFDPTLTTTEQQVAWQKGSDAADRAEALALTTDVLFGAAIVSAGIAVYLYLAHDADEASATLRPMLAPGGTGVRAAF
jgi:PEGA domain/Tetratricopeptide repeat